ncbi:hypothetical protein Poli38472_013023 [Pythium oligandrum]|uniref:Uncharacterized protein n=1 Tax=Pythium oligandrum TaxID=41045 RepID=A0A8K1CIU9_PYTOL|nr:hypothetical protein Poli38472_013023 [Pythium oligandrum]|eukprot:TMW64401.1 hypothetical protein Poli38472_013023 [Pythium oligandrum]
MVYSIMHQNWHMSAYSRDASAHNIDILNLVAISLNFCVRMYAAGNRWAYCRHWISIVDFCCWIPLFVDAAAPFDETKQSKYVFRLFLMARTIRIVQLYRLLRLVKHAKVRQGISIGLTVVSIIICAAAMIQTVEYCDPTITTQVFGENCQNLSFSDSIYFICITIGTVGYGEYAPKSKIGKVSTICLIIFTGLLIPTQISALTEILSRETIFDKKYRPDKRIQHVLLCGDIDNGSLNFFLHNWLHSDGERGSRRKVIILSPTFPSSSLRRILIHREYEQRVQYLQGSAMDTNDLQRAGATSAACCFVMVRKHSDTEERSDTSTNLLTCSIRKNNRQAPLYVQVSKVDNVRHVNISGASAVVCVEQLKLSMFGKSLWIRGLNAFLGNLVQRFDITNESRSDNSVIN